MWLFKHFDIFFWMLFAGCVLSGLAHFFLAPSVDQVETTHAALRWVEKYYPNNREVVIVCPAVDTPNKVYLRCQARIDGRTITLDCKDEGCRVAYTTTLTTTVP